MPATSGKQQHFMALVHMVQQGRVKKSKVSKDIKDAAKSMTQKETGDFMYLKKAFSLNPFKPKVPQISWRELQDAVEYRIGGSTEQLKPTMSWKQIPSEFPVHPYDVVRTMEAAMDSAGIRHGLSGTQTLQSTISPRKLLKAKTLKDALEDLNASLVIGSTEDEDQSL